MRKINFENKFDAVVNLFTSFGYFSDPENLESLKRISKSLKKGGKLLIDTLNRDWMIKYIQENRTMNFDYPDNKVFKAKNSFIEAFGNNSVYGNDHPEPYSVSHRNMIILAEKI